MTVIDGATDSVIDILGVGICPIALCYNPTNNKVYCANNHTHNVTVVDGETNGILATVWADSFPTDLCYNQIDNKVYCTAMGAWGLRGTVTVIDGALNHRVALVMVECRPIAVRHNPRDDKVYCVNSYTNSNSVTVIDGRTNVADTTIDVGPNPISLACNPDQVRVYVGNHEGSSVSVLRDNPAGIDRVTEQRFSRFESQPTIVSGVLLLGIDNRQHSTYRAELLDISGRKVLDLKPGPNDVRMLAPGVYFVPARRGTTARTTKVMVVRN
jgi:YVTN family beta-propeller protein